MEYLIAGGGLFLIGAIIATITARRLGTEVARNLPGGAIGPAFLFGCFQISVLAGFLCAAAGLAGHLLFFKILSHDKHYRSK